LGLSVCGTKTNILHMDAYDAYDFVHVVRVSRRNITISEVSADKAYASLETFEEVAACGGKQSESRATCR
jgi:hypothetical protein